MRWSYVAAGAGMVLGVGGVALFAYGIARIVGDGSSAECIANGCDGPWLTALPVGIIAMVFGLVLVSRGVRSIRAQGGIGGPLNAFGPLTGLGLLVLIPMGAVLLLVSSTLGLLLFLLGLGFVGVDVWKFRRAVAKDRLRVSGLHGTATVISVGDSNITINGNPMVNVELEVDLPGQALFRVRQRATISPLTRNALSAGTVLSVLADPARPTDVTIDWEAFAAAPGGAAGAFLQVGEVDGVTGKAIDMVSGMLDPIMLRAISEAVAGAAAAGVAARAGEGRSETRLADGTTVIDGGTTVIDGGTTVLIDGRPVELGAGLGAALGASILKALGAGGDQQVIRHIAEAHPPDGPDPAPPGGPSLPDAPVAAVQGLEPGPDALAARVSLDSILDGGVDIGEGRLYTFDLSVSVAGRRPYPTKFAAVVPKALVPRLLKGASFPARVDPNVPAQLSVQWDR